jgi:hypothetical protein
VLVQVIPEPLYDFLHGTIQQHLRQILPRLAIAPGGYGNTPLLHALAAAQHTIEPAQRQLLHDLAKVPRLSSRCNIIIQITTRGV